MFLKKLLFLSGISISLLVDSYAMRPSVNQINSSRQQTLRAKKDELPDPDSESDESNSDSDNNSDREHFDSRLVTGMLFQNKATKIYNERKLAKRLNKEKRNNQLPIPPAIQVQKPLQAKEPKVSFQDIVGGIPDRIKSIVHKIKNNPGQNTAVKKPYRILLEGPPGTGKTTLAEAIAKELGRQFYKINAGSIVTSYQGSGAQRIKELFEAIAASEQDIVVFIDEIDALANKNSSDSNGESYKAVCQLQTQIDEAGPQVICILATNNLDHIHDALKDRFGQNIITIGLPSYDKRLAILKHYLKDEQVQTQGCLPEIACDTNGLSYRALEDMVEVAQDLVQERHIAHPDQPKVLTKNDLSIAMYLSQKVVLPVHRSYKLLLQHFAQKHNVTLSQELIHILASKVSGITAQEISEFIESSVFLSRARNADNVQLGDVYAAMYAHQTKKLPGFKERIILLNYYLRNRKNTISMEIKKQIVQDMIDDFTAQEIQSLIREADGAASVRNEEIINNEDFYIGFYQELLKKAKPTNVSCNITRMQTHVSAGSCSVGVVSASYGKWISNNIAIEETTQLPKNGEFLKNTSTGEHLKTNRLDYINNYFPSNIHREAIIKYILRCNNMQYEGNEQINVIIQTLVRQSQGLSCYTLTQLIEKAIEQAIFNSRIILQENDVMIAAQKLYVNLESFKLTSGRFGDSCIVS